MSFRKRKTDITQWLDPQVQVKQEPQLKTPRSVTKRMVPVEAKEFLAPLSCSEKLKQEEKVPNDEVTEKQVESKELQDTCNVIADACASVGSAETKDDQPTEPNCDTQQSHATTNDPESLGHIPAKEATLHADADSFHPGDGSPGTTVAGEPVQAHVGHPAVEEFAAGAKTHSSKTQISVAGSVSGFDDDVAGAGSDDDFDGEDTRNWLKETPLKDHVKVTATYLQEVTAPPINSSTGLFEDGLEYPNTFPSMEKLDSELEGKRIHMSSSFHIEREIQSRNALAKRIRDREETTQIRTAPPVAAAPVEEPEWPKAECKVVPATEDHFSQIADIINLESEATDRVPQVLESARIKSKDIKHIAEYCRTRLRPFVVAINVPDDITDPSKWPQKSQGEYEKYMAWKRAQPKERSAVVGFAFVMDPKLGFLLPKSDPGARFTGSIRLLVHPEHRGKKYGLALLDRVLLSTAPYHRSLIDYGWDEPERGGLVYEWRVCENQRQYSQLFIEINTKAGDKDLEWKHKILDYYDFEKVACFPKMLRTDRGKESEDLDVEFWRMITSQKPLDQEPGEYLKPRP